MAKIGIDGRRKGAIVPAMLIIVGAMVAVIYGLLFVLALQIDFSYRQMASEQALHVAEAGVNYYRWHLAHDGTDFQDGTGGSGPYVHDFIDPQGGNLGKYSLEIIPPQLGSSIIEIVSTGWTTNYPGVKRVIRARYGKPSLAKFAFLHNSNIWFGNGTTINGPVFSNGGIRQDGVNTSTVESAKSIYTCGIETGCVHPTEKPGVWGNGGPQSLWRFPVPVVDFNGISVDFVRMKNEAGNAGLYLGPSGAQGYHLVFSGNGSVELRRVTRTNYYQGYSPDNGCERLYQRIVQEVAVQTYQVSDVPIVFAEDTLWIEGTVKGRVSVVAARFPIDTNNVDIWIPNNIMYTARDGSDRLGLIAQRDIIFARDVPDDFEIDAAMLAQKGRIIRHHYNYQGCSHGGAAIKNELVIFGSVISNQKSYWNFSGGPGVPASGFVKREITYDSGMYFDPPPYFPEWGDYEFLSWKEE